MGKINVVIGAGLIGIAIARRISAGKPILLADRSIETADKVAEDLRNAGFEVTTMAVDISSPGDVQALAEKAASMGEVTGLVLAAGVSPSQAPKERVLEVDLYGSALVLEAFRAIIAEGGAGLVIASMSGHRLPALSPEEDKALATTPAAQLLSLPLVQPEAVRDSLHAYQLAKRGNALRVMAEAVAWGKRGARINSMSPGIVMTPLARDELNGPRGEGYKKMLAGSAAGRAANADEIATFAALMMGPDGAFITGSDVLIDGGVTAAFFYGDTD